MTCPSIALYAYNIPELIFKVKIMRIKNINFFANTIMNKKPSARAEILGGPLAPSIHGTINFYPVYNGTLVVAEVYNLPKTVGPAEGTPPVNPFGFHIHEGNTCDTGNPSDPFQAAGEHWNPTGQPHGNHAIMVIKNQIKDSFLDYP